MDYVVWRVEIGGREGWLVKVIITLLEICEHIRFVIMEMFVHLLHLFLLDGSTYSEDVVIYLYCHSYLFIIC